MRHVESILPGVFSLMDRLLPFAFAEPAFMKRALLALLLTAPAAAALGVPLVQHRMAFFSDAIGHSAFTGVALGVLLGVSPSWTMVAFGAVVAVAITLVKGRTGLSSDTVIGVFFSTVVALGIAIISREKGLTRNLQAFLYGDPLAVTDPELLWMAALFLLVAAYLAFLYNRILLLGIHEGFARTKGVRVPAVEISFALIVALVVTAAIHTVGILLGPLGLRGGRRAVGVRRDRRLLVSRHRHRRDRRPGRRGLFRRHRAVPGRSPERINGRRSFPLRRRTPPFYN
jgi:zinc transport system permease protein